MTAPVLPKQRAVCPTCGTELLGLLAGCDKPACVTAEIDAIVAQDAACEAADDE